MAPAAAYALGFGMPFGRVLQLCEFNVSRHIYILLISDLILPRCSYLPMGSCNYDMLRMRHAYAKGLWTTASGIQYGDRYAENALN